GDRRAGAVRLGAQSAAGRGRGARRRGRFLRVGAGAAALAVSAAYLARLGDGLATALAEWHRAQPDVLGAARGALFARLRGLAPEAALDAALAVLVAD